MEHKDSDHRDGGTQMNHTLGYLKLSRKQAFYKTKNLCHS